MRIFISTVLCCCAFIGANAATDDAATDSITTFVKPDSVVFVQGKQTTELRVYGSDSNPEYYYTYKGERIGDYETTKEGWDFSIPFVDKKAKTSTKAKRSLYSFECGGFGFGFVDALNAPAAMNVNMASSYEIFIDHLLGVRCRPWRNGTSFMLGFGLNWRNYRMTGGKMFAKDDAGKIGFADYEENADVKFSRLKIFSLTVPVMFSQELGKGFELSAGAVVNFNVHGSMETKYKLDNKDITQNDDNIHQQKVTVDLMAHLKFKAIGAYVKYTPTNIIDTNYGPKFNGISAGVTLCY